MPRYFLEVFYKGTHYSGFQVQHNANTVQSEIEKAMNTLFRLPSQEEGELVKLTSSSRTDAGVHALQNFFHFDTAVPVSRWRDIGDEARFLYKMNAVLPEDIVVRRLLPVADDAHSRFDAVSREYKYFIYQKKDPFLKDRAYFFPYKVDVTKLNEAAAVVREYEDFTSFSKRNTQVKTFICRITESEWVWENGCLVYHVMGNRFLRGMVRALTATMLRVGRGKMTVEDFHAVIRAKDCTRAYFSVPAHGLFLVSVAYPDAFFG